MKPISLLLLTFLGINTVSLAQDQECGTPSDAQNQDFPSLRTRGIGANTTFAINVFFHIVRHSNKSHAPILPNTDAIVRKVKRGIQKKHEK